MRDGHHRRGKAFEESELVQAAVNLWLNEMRFGGYPCGATSARGGGVGVSHSPSLGGPPLPKAARASARSTPIPASAGGPCLAARAAVARPLPPLLRAAADSGLCPMHRPAAPALAVHG